MYAPSSDYYLDAVTVKPKAVVLFGSRVSLVGVSGDALPLCVLLHHEVVGHVQLLLQRLVLEPLLHDLAAPRGHLVPVTQLAQAGEEVEAYMNEPGCRAERPQKLHGTV